MPTKKKPCRHRTSWIILGGYAEWCYFCGAWRRLQPMERINVSYPATTWVKPTHDKNDNPYEKQRDLTHKGLIPKPPITKRRSDVKKK